MRSKLRVVLSAAVLASCTSVRPPAARIELGGLPSIADKTAGMEPHPGFFPFYWDGRTGKVWVEVPRLGEDFLYVAWLATGLGSNPVGLDRGQSGGEKVVRFERIGPKILLVQRNLRYRALSDDPDERRAVAESFAQSVLWGGEVAAVSGDRVLVDFTTFLIRDARDVAGRLRRSGQGTFRLDPKRSAVFLPRTKAFPRNTELEVLLTFASPSPGPRVRETTPTPQAVTLRERHSLVALPEPGYVPRRFDPRAGTNSIVFADYAAPLGEPLEKRWITRHRLQKKDPGAPRSEPKRPIVYYVDRGVPEPVRSALLDGARWWNEAFEAAGFENAFRVDLLPEGADPLDVRYNMIQWVHRSTRGWSYGRSIVDPRTGEILKGHVSLGSLRVRQDRLIFDGVAEPSGCGAGAGPDAGCFVPFDPAADPVALALARIRQLAAHEVGHSLGFAHNFAASSFGRGSVMDYPGPLVRLTETGDVDLSDAYATGIGDWDRVAVRWAYSEWPRKEDEGPGLAVILAEARRRGMIFVTDQDARPLGAANARASLWDNGDDPVRELDRVMAVRRATLRRFGAAARAPGRPRSELEEQLVPLYLQHRYQVAATAKLVGGAFYDYGVPGDGGSGPWPVPPDRQRQALAALLKTVDPAELTLPESVLDLLAPPAFGHNTKAETFPGRTGALFDPIAAARVAADLTIAAILEPSRAARLVQLHQRDARYPGLGEVLAAMTEAIRGGQRRRDGSGLRTAVRRSVDRAFLDRLLALAEGPAVDPDVRALTSRCLAGLADAGPPPGDAADAAHEAELRRRIRRFLGRPHSAARPATAPAAPPGSPIGR